jgi:hypothetical protein
MKQKFAEVELVPDQDYLSGNALGGGNISRTYLNRLEFAARIGITSDFNLNDRAAKHTYKFTYVASNYMIKDNVTGKEYTGWLYTVTMDGKEEQKLSVLVPKTDGTNDIPLISGENINIQNRTHSMCVNSGEATWIIANQNNLSTLRGQRGNAANPFLQ